MRNILAIAQKELRSYFASPIGYIVIGFFALLYGWFYVTMLNYFVRQSMQMAQFGGGPEAMNVNQVMIRPLLQNVTILLLFLMPMVTMRSYAEEKRSGTIELLLTSPLTDLEIILGKFLGALALWARGARGHRHPHRAAVRLRNSGMEADRDRLSGPAPDGRLLHLGGNAHFEPDQQPDRRRHGHVRRLPLALGHQLDRQLFRPDGG